MKQLGLFDESNRLEDLSNLGDPLEKLNGAVDWELFEPVLNRVFKRERRGSGGRPPYPYLLMFKILILQRLFNISDDQTEYQIKDRMTFMRFLGLGISDRVPDAKTIWLFREHLTKAGVIKELFDLYERHLTQKGLITRSGSIIDASFVDAPRQRNTPEENRQIKEGRIPEEWRTPDNMNKLRQKDVDARWAKKGHETHYGYKNEPKVDVETKLITDYTVMSANVHDRAGFVDLIDPEKDRIVYGDSAYAGMEISEKVRNKAKKKKRRVKLEIIEQGYRGKPLTQRQRASNKRLSKVRCRIEHVFGFMTNSMGGMTLRTIGIDRAKFNIGLTNLIYNMCRCGFLCRPAPATG